MIVLYDRNKDILCCFLPCKWESVMNIKNSFSVKHLLLCKYYRHGKHRSICITLQKKMRFNRHTHNLVYRHARWIISFSHHASLFARAPYQNSKEICSARVVAHLAVFPLLLLLYCLLRIRTNIYGTCMHSGKIYYVFAASLQSKQEPPNLHI